MLTVPETPCLVIAPAKYYQECYLHMTGGHKMRRDKSLNKITRSGGFAVLLKKIREVQASEGGEAISNWMGNVMGSGEGDLTMTQGKPSFEWFKS